MSSQDSTFSNLSRTKVTYERLFLLPMRQSIGKCMYVRLLGYARLYLIGTPGCAMSCVDTPTVFGREGHSTVS